MVVKLLRSCFHARSAETDAVSKLVCWGAMQLGSLLDELMEAHKKKPKISANKC